MHIYTFIHACIHIYTHTHTYWYMCVVLHRFIYCTIYTGPTALLRLYYCYVCVLLHASYTPLTRLLHASYTPGPTALLRLYYCYVCVLLHASYTPLTRRAPRLYYCYISVHILLYMCAHNPIYLCCKGFTTATYVSSYCYMCVLILLYMLYMCADTGVDVSSYRCVSVLIPVHGLHGPEGFTTAIYASSYTPLTRLLHHSYTPLTLLHASYTPLTPLIQVHGLHGPECSSRQGLLLTRPLENKKKKKKMYT